MSCVSPWGGGGGEAFECQNYFLYFSDMHTAHASDASNTEVHAGTCVLLEEKMDRDLIGLACWHHIMELIAAKVFDTRMGPSSRPSINLYQQFCEYCSSFDQSSYESGLNVDCIASALSSVWDDLIHFIRQQLTKFQFRESCWGWRGIAFNP